MKKAAPWSQSIIKISVKASKNWLSENRLSVVVRTIDFNFSGIIFLVDINTIYGTYVQG